MSEGGGRGERGDMRERERENYSPVGQFPPPDCVFANLISM